MGEPIDRLFADIILAQKLVDAPRVEAALAKLAERRQRGAGGSLVEILLDAGDLSPDAALKVRAEYDRQTRAAAAKSAVEREPDVDVSPEPTRIGTRAITATGTAITGANTAANAPVVGTATATGYGSQGISNRLKATFSDSPDSDTAKVAPKDPLVGKAIGGCEVLDKLGEGGMGAVYRARHLGLDKLVAVKILARSMIDDDIRIERFKREAKSAAQIEHPNIVQILNVGEQDGVHYIVMQYIHGEDLRHRLARKGPLSATEVFDIATQVAKGLKIAHEKGIVHRDIKPDNIMYDEQERIKITDFGLAKQVETDVTTTRPGRAVGTPYYMSPEQCAGKEVDARSDIYSLGATLYHVATGKRPFKGDTPVQTALMHLRTPPVPPLEMRPDLPRSLNGLILRMLEKNPDDRFQNCDELLIALEVAESRLDTKRRPASVVELMGSGSSVSQAIAKPPMEDETEPALPAAKTARDEQDETSLASAAVSDSPTPRSGMAAISPSASAAGSASSPNLRSPSKSGVPARSPSGHSMPAPPPMTEPFPEDDADASAVPRLLLAAMVGFIGLGLMVVIWAISTGFSQPTTPDPSGTPNGILPGIPTGNGTTDGGAGSPTDDDEKAKLEAAAKAEFEKLSEFTTRLVAERMFDHAIERVDKFAAQFAGTSSESAAKSLRNDLRNECLKMCRQDLRQLVDAANARARSDSFGRALELLDNAALERYIELLKFDTLQRDLDKARQEIRDRATRETDSAIDEANRMLRADPPQLFEARLGLQQISGRLDLPDMKSRIVAKLDEIDRRLKFFRDSRNAAIIETLRFEHDVVQEFVAGLDAYATLADSPEQIARAIDKLDNEWLRIPARGAAHPLAHRLINDFEALAGFYAGVDAALSAAQRAGQPVALAVRGAEVVRWKIWEVRAGAGFAGSPETAPDRWGERTAVTYADISAETLAEMARKFVEPSHPLGVPLFLLARDARRELRTYLATTPAMDARFTVGAQQSLFAIYRAAVPGSEALKLAVEGMDNPSVQSLAEGRAQQALTLDPWSGPACLALAFVDVAQNRLSRSRERMAQAAIPYRDRPLYVIVDASLAIQANAPDDAWNKVNRLFEKWGHADPVSPFEKYIASRAYYLRAISSVMKGKLKGQTQFALEQVDFENALRLDPAAEDVYREMKINR